MWASISAEKNENFIKSVKDLFFCFTPNFLNKQRNHQENLPKAHKQPNHLNKHLLTVAKYWLGGFTAFMLLFYAIISIK